MLKAPCVKFLKGAKMAVGDEVFIHKVQRNEKIDSIIEEYYGVLPFEHMCAMRNHIYYLNQTHSYYTVRTPGTSVASEPYEGELLMLPAQKTLKDYYLVEARGNHPQIGAFANHPITREDGHRLSNLSISFGARSDINRFQETFDPLMAIAFCEISDGICYILSQKEKHREYFKEYTGNYFKESAEKIAESGAEFYASLNTVQKLLVDYSSSNEMTVRQGLKKEIIKAHKEMTKNLSPLVKDWAQKYMKPNQYKSLSSSSRAMDVSDLYAKVGAPRPVILKKSFDTYLKYVKYGKYAPALGTLADFVDANYDAYKDYKLHNNVWQKNLFKKDAGILPLVFVGYALGSIVIIEGLPLLLLAGIGVVAASAVSHLFESTAEYSYDRWLK